MPRLRIEPSRRVRLINPPAGFDGVQSVASEPFDVVLLFAAGRAELERGAPAATASSLVRQRKAFHCSLTVIGITPTRPAACRTPHPWSRLRSVADRKSVV